MIPVLINKAAPGAAAARELLENNTGVAVRELDSAAIADEVRAEAQRATRRVVVCGGDGTLSSAFGAAAGTSLEVGILPGGTLNHFARDYGIPVDDPAAALQLALNGTARPVDLGYVNDHPILNTSSIGVYVDFVQRRERLERWLPYRIASAAAAIAVWRDPRALSVELHSTNGVHRRLETPLVFVGIQERELARGSLAERRANGARALHILVVKEHRRPRVHRLALRSLLHGIDGVVDDGEVESHLSDAVVVTGEAGTYVITIDGELVDVKSPLEFRIARDAVLGVCP
jgi:diacylglycerol kinase family enzyme